MNFAFERPGRSNGDLPLLLTDSTALALSVAWILSLVPARTLVPRSAGTFAHVPSVSADVPVISELSLRDNIRPSARVSDDRRARSEGS